METGACQPKTPGISRINFEHQQVKPKLILFFLRPLGIGGNKCRFTPWIFSTFILACALDQFVCDCINHRISLILKIMFLVNFLNSFVALLFTVRNRNQINRLIAGVFSKLRGDEVAFIKKYERITFFLVLLFVWFLFAINFSLDVYRYWKLKHLLVLSVQSAPFVLWISLILFKLAVSIFTAILYIVCSLYVVTFISLTLTRLNQLNQMTRLIPHEGHSMMKQLIEMEKSFESLEKMSSFPFCQMISMHFVEITLFLYRMISISTSSNLILLCSTLWTCMNITFVLFLMASVIHFQEKIKSSGESLAHSFFAHRLTPAEYIFISILVDKIKCVTSQSITVWRIVQINRRLILAIYSSFLTISVLLVQVDNGSLGSDGVARNISSVWENKSKHSTYSHTWGGSYLVTTNFRLTCEIQRQWIMESMIHQLSLLLFSRWKVWLYWMRARLGAFFLLRPAAGEKATFCPLFAGIAAFPRLRR